MRDEARAGERYLIEVETGLPPGASPQAMPRDGFDPALTTLLDRARAKAAELGVSLRTVQAHRARYSSQGVWGLVDQRAARMRAVTGRVDARLVAAVRAVVVAETDTSTGTRSRLIRRVTKAVEAEGGVGWCRCRVPPRSTSSSTPSPPAAHVRVRAHPPPDGQPAGGGVHAVVGRPARRAGADRLDPIDLLVVLDTGILEPTLVEAALPLELADALDDESYDAELRQKADYALALTGRDVGTPIIQVQPPEGVAFFGPVISRLPSREQAGPLWDNVVGLASFPGLAELKRRSPQPA